MSNKTLFLLLLILAGILYFRGDDLQKALSEQKSKLYPEQQEQSNMVDTTGSIQTYNKDNRKLNYRVFIPDKTSKTKFPVMVCIGGQNSEGNEYFVHPYRTFAEKNGFAIVTVAFKNFDNKEFRNRKSYQHPQAWSASALNRILAKLAQTYPINPFKLYLFGFSAGAQFVHRYSLQYSSRAVACAAHGAGGYDWPKRYTRTQMIITVGEKDKKRIKGFNQFVAKAREKNIRIWSEIIPGVSHYISDKQWQMSFDFFARIKNGRQVLH